eukprot:TRINITY_DN12856_c0_g1_i1.p2 TRINITY_DN12856_c0_g1~~TRINITY_DN12856_c0_g1_i1.p2  ORF type:complete len:191 (-),score=24.79 TRINITY_DN12856_c0_g1_i1:334-906(-)
MNPTTLAITSKYLGSNQYLEAKQIFFRCTFVAIAFSVIISALLLLSQNHIIALFTKDPQVIYNIGAAVMVTGCTSALDGVSACVEGAMMANKQAKQVGFNSLVSTIIALVSAIVVNFMGIVSVTSFALVTRIVPIGRIWGNYPQLFFNQPAFDNESQSQNGNSCNGENNFSAKVVDNVEGNIANKQKQQL